ncbi:MULTISPECIES: zeta toxin family protein [Paraburkholderia]|uniref:Zeta toxin family protein n=1 Tax=Paraburkholderia madseniana TaxID=2599607 RepID=A0AAP5BJN0_9BURK|nr:MULTISPECIES: zeta toxin family protein [Paraburkholderia]MCX4151047.1 zeta toxin family protein [Paraburkholderia madseniana]MCX4176687.1 zeta toxin family protein [Paraburkholderia madseniana]MDN7153979.1 zeta toxin family protein [Paraburkholderia sp. WS6]MDQ6412861.1 zeta toxin family protein [Paraburkholderia madseniana]MDQ6464678.1 zeta toxin family protein [Paraburkholderia madseniana]
MELENIRYVNYEQPDRQRVQDNAIRAVKEDPGRLIEAYRHDARSFDGRYVAADLFKETFPEFSASKEARNRYNNPVHNAAAVLSSALFSENLKEPRESGRETVYFLTGVPGAGKTSLILGEGRLPRDAHMVFEGQMSDYATSEAKISQVIAAGFRPHIMVVHVRSEYALDKTIQRFYEEGRGSSIATIAKIQGGLPESLARLGAYFGNDLLLDIVDVRDRANPVRLSGHENIHILKSEGSHEHIQQRLEARLQQHRQDGRINDDAYRQAAGLAPGSGHGVDRERNGNLKENESGRGVPQRDRVPSVLTHAPGGDSPSTSQAAQHTPLRITDAHNLPPEIRKAGIRGHVIEANDKTVLVRTGKTDAVRFSRSEISGKVEPGKRIEMTFKPLEQEQGQSPKIEQKRGLNN